MNSFLFNEHYNLRTAVIEGEKTMTRRLVGNRMTDGDIKAYFKGYTELANKCAPYKINDVVAVAEPYKNIFEPDVLLQGSKVINGKRKKGWYPAIELGGWNNSMFICPEYMRHFVRITDVKVERLQDISDEDCFKEGIIPITWRQYLPQEPDDFSPQKYIDHNVYTLEKFREGIEDCWAESDPNEYMAEEANVAFAVLIFKTLGRKVWDANPWVFAYSFKLVK